MGHETDAWAIRFVLECAVGFERPCVAGALLLVSFGFAASMGGPAVCGTGSDAGGISSSGGAVAVVERGGALRSGGARRDAGNGDMAVAMG